MYKLYDEVLVDTSLVDDDEEEDNDWAESTLSSGSDDEHLIENLRSET